MNHFFELSLVRTRFGLVSEAKTSRLGYLWWVVEPVLQIAAYYLVFGVLLLSFRNSGGAYSGQAYVSFLICGVIPWVCFSRAASHSVGVILNGGWLIKNLNINKLYFPLTTFLQDYTKSLVMFVSMIAMLALLGHLPTFEYLWLIPVILLQGIFTLSVCICLSAIAPFQPDIKYLVPLALQILMFTSGVFFDVSAIAPEMVDLFFLNPVAVFLDLYRSVLLAPGGPVDSGKMLMAMGKLTVISGVLLAGGVAFIHKMNKVYPAILK